MIFLSINEKFIFRINKLSFVVKKMQVIKKYKNNFLSATKLNLSS